MVFVRKYTRTSEDIIAKQWSTFNQNIIVNTISRHLYASDKIQDVDIIFC